MMQRDDFLLISLILEVVKEHRKRARLLPEVGDDRAARPDGLLHLTVGIKLGQSTPGPKVLPGVDHDHGYLPLGAQGAYELLVLLVLAVLSEAAQSRRAAIEGLGAFVQSLAQSVVNEGLLQDLQNKTMGRGGLQYVTRE
jgi:hypothetical protein